MNMNITAALVCATILCMAFSQTRKYGIIAVVLLCLAYPKIISSLVVIFAGLIGYKHLFSK